MLYCFCPSSNTSWCKEQWKYCTTPPPAPPHSSWPVPWLSLNPLSSSNNRFKFLKQFENVKFNSFQILRVNAWHAEFYLWRKMSANLLFRHLKNVFKSNNAIFASNLHAVLFILNKLFSTCIFKTNPIGKISFSDHASRLNEVLFKINLCISPVIHNYLCKNWSYTGVLTRV